jgi:hypothetical protein
MFLLDKQRSEIPCKGQIDRFDMKEHASHASQGAIVFAFFRLPFSALPVGPELPPCMQALPRKSSFKWLDGDCHVSSEHGEEGRELFDVDRCGKDGLRDGR